MPTATANSPTPTTDGNGSYSFDGLDPGTYTVAEVQQPGWQQTSPVGSVPSIERVNVANDGTQGNDSYVYGACPAISADGRYVAFISSASNLVDGDTNGFADVFVRDRKTGTIERVSLADDGTQANASSALPEISADGRYVAFRSTASNLVPGDTNGFTDVFVYDREIGTIERVSVAADGTQGDNHSHASSISADGRYVSFASSDSNLVSGDTNNRRDVFVRDRQAGTTERVSVANNGMQGNDDSMSPSISADGRYVAFWSGASNLVPGDTNGGSDIFVYDRQTHSIERVNRRCRRHARKHLLLFPRSAPTAAMWHFILGPATSSQVTPMASQMSSCMTGRQT